MPATPRPRPVLPRPGDRIRDRYGPIRCMAAAEGYVLCRRPHAMPFMLSAKGWAALKRVGESLDAKQSDA